MINRRNLIFFGKASAAAQLSDYNKVHIGAIAIYKNKVIGVGYNTYKTHPNQRKYDKYRKLNYGDSLSTLHAMHAEIMCLNSIKRTDIKWDKVELYIFRPRKSTPTGLSRPCPACMNMIKDYGIRHIYYTTDESYAYEYLIDAKRKKEVE